MKTIGNCFATFMGAGLLAALAVAGCTAALREPLPSAPVTASAGTGTAEVRLDVAATAGRVVQVAVSAYTTTSIATLDVVPYLKTGTTRSSRWQRPAGPRASGGPICCTPRRRRPRSV